MLETKLAEKEAKRNEMAQLREAKLKKLNDNLEQRAQKRSAIAY